MQPYYLFLAISCCLLSVSVTAWPSAYNQTGAILATRQTCDPGFIACDYYGCVAGDQCPDQCNARGVDTCAFGANGHGCRWESDTCIQDLTCGRPVDGQCAAGCIECGSLRCTVAGLTCPTPCGGLPDANTCNGAAQLGDVGCRWQDTQCVDFDTLHQVFVTPTPVSTSASATATDSTSTTATATESTESEPSVDESPDMAPIQSSNMGRIGAIIGGVVGGLALLGIIILMAHRYLQKRAERQRNGIRLEDNDFGGAAMKMPDVRYKPDEFLPAVRSALHLGDIKHSHNRALPTD
ncbi:hypothetical protein H4R33_003435 [Dimargaris cristalligena]|nr:hypothetical protein H4R33_003435 [Dimargaris cristalligena]